MSKKSRKEEEHEGNSERWLLTYSDMITLLLVLFIMMYTISSVDSQKFKALAEGLGIALNPGSSAAMSGAGSGGSGSGSGEGEEQEQDIQKYINLPRSEETLSPSETPQDTGMIVENNLERELNQLFASNGLSGYVSAHREERGVVVSLIDALLFPSGSAEINENAKDILMKITNIVNSTDNYIRVEGSTDNDPINSSQFPSNWELASQRAINVAKMLINDGVDPSRISATSYGEYRPVVANDSTENKGQNRRVDIVFLNTDLNASEPGAQN